MISLIKPSGLTRCGVNATEPTKLAPVVMERFGHSAQKSVWTRLRLCTGTFRLSTSSVRDLLWYASLSAINHSRAILLRC